MFHSRHTNNRINRLHERALKIVYDDGVSTFNSLLAMDKSSCIHHQNIQRLLTEIYKALHDISGKSLTALFVKRKSTISMWSKPELLITSVNSALKSKNSLRYFCPVIWSLQLVNLILVDFAYFFTLSFFKERLNGCLVNFHGC